MTTTETPHTITDGHARDAAAVHDLLLTDQPTTPPTYDGVYTITVGRIHAYFAPRGVQITYPDPWGVADDPDVTVIIAHPFTLGALHTVITALSQLVHQ